MPRTITIDDQLFSALSAHVGSADIDRYVGDMIQRRVADLDALPTDEELEAGYRAMAADEEHEREALEWSEALAGDRIS